MWPAISHWCRRLVETVVALVLSKFVIVAVLSLAVGALGAGDGSVSAGSAGGALLLLAAFAPFTLLRLVPMVEVGAPPTSSRGPATGSSTPSAACPDRARRGRLRPGSAGRPDRCPSRPGQ